MAGAGRPLPGCPARAGAGSFGVDDAEFVFHAGDCRHDGEPVTEVFGFFCPPGWRETPNAGGDDSDAVLTAGFEVPAGSPVARLAHLADTAGGVALIARRLRADIAECPCTGTDDCAALDELNFLAAIEQAAASSRRRGRMTGRLWHE
jgi:hypothetical protein